MIIFHTWTEVMGTVMTFGRRPPIECCPLRLTVKPVLSQRFSWTYEILYPVVPRVVSC